MTEQILDALAALRPETRKQMVKELEEAKIDTSAEFAKSMTICTKAKLADELRSIETFLDKIGKVDAEYVEIHRSPVSR